MKARYVVVVIAAAGAMGLAGYGLYRLGTQHAATGVAPVAPATSAGTERKPLYWHDPMVPGQKFDKPGKSPFMDMELVPVYGGDAGDEGKIVISPRVQQNLGVRTAEVTSGSVTTNLSAVGSVAYNDRDVVLVQARSNGFVERLYVRAPLDPVKKGQPLADLYVPDWVAAQEEYLAIKRMQGNDMASMVEASLQRMRLAGMNDEQVRRVVASGKVQGRITLTAPVSGVVSELTAREGMTIMNGAPLFRINGLQTVWVNAEVPENVATDVRPGMAVEARTPSLPGAVFKGKIAALLPEVNAATRTLKARVELANPAGQLVPGMFATLAFSGAARKDVLRVPSEAVIQTGRRNVVMLALAEGRFAPADVEIGADRDGQTEIRKGLEAGQKVVVSGQFLIDSEASLKGTIARMGEVPATGATHHGEGKVESIDKEEITLSHGPIPSLKWGEMTMGFKLPAGGLPRKVAVGDSIGFDLRARADGQFEIVTISPMPAKAAGTAP